MKITFKTEKPTGKWRSFYNSSTYIKADGKKIGMFGDDKDGKIKVSVMAMKNDTIKDDNPNCKWKWVTFKARFDDMDSAKAWCVKVLPTVNNFEFHMDETVRFKDFERMNEGIMDIVRKGMSAIKGRNASSRLQDIVDDYRKAMTDYWDDFFDAAAKYSAAKREVEAARRDYSARSMANEKLHRAEGYISAVERHGKGIEAMAYKRAKAVAGDDAEVRAKFQGMMDEVVQEMNADAKRRYRELTDKDARERKDLLDRDAKRKDWMFDEEEPAGKPKEEPKDEGPKQRDKTLAELGVHDATDFALEDEDAFWSKADKMSKENLKVVLSAAKRRYKDIEDELEDELRGYRAELKNHEGKADAANMAKVKALKQDIASATKGATEDQEILADRIERLKAKIDTEFHGIR
jgi:anti-sigma28 factor (negative regulator of flagellin synthesis)